MTHFANGNERMTCTQRRYTDKPEKKPFVRNVRRKSVIVIQINIDSLSGNGCLHKHHTHTHDRTIIMAHE